MGTGKPSASMACRVHGAVLLSEVSHKPVERRGAVDVVPERQFDQIETQRGRAVPRLRRNSVGAPGDVGEQSPMGSPHAEEIMRSLGAIRCQ